ncbi:MAG: metal-dependent hydrolase [Spirulinaceae cyanobacterium RM2_2_10]|nr:metal-dependent hydrolase [Spirulinaceae cyanobacterium RM2_2_10]
MVKKLLLAVALVLGIPLIGLTIFFFWASSGRYPRDRYAEIVEFETSATAAEPNSDNEFTVVTYNIGYLSGLTNNEAVARSPEFFQANLDQAIAALRDLNPDLIALQEIDIQARRSFNINQVTALAEDLGLPVGAIAVNWDKNYLPFPYWPLSAHFGRLVSGQALLSRGAIASHERLVLETVEAQPFFYQAFYISRLAQIAELTLGGRELVVINVHLEAFDAPTRRRQTEFVQELLTRYADQPLLLVGDFNSPLPSSEFPDAEIQILLGEPRLQAAIATPEANTFPADAPIAKLDYIFYTPEWLELVAAQVVEAAGTASDHLPVAARLRWRDGE